MNKLEPFDITLHGHHLVEASAGTGKTYSITSLFIRCLVDTDLTVDQLLVLTYTKAATAELKDRILSRVRESISVLAGQAFVENDTFLENLIRQVQDAERAIQKLERAVHNFDEASIFTIHSFCQRTLQEQSFLSGIIFDAELITDDREILQEAVDDWWRQQVQKAGHSDIQREWLNILRQTGHDPEGLARLVAPALGKPYLNLRVPEPPEGTRNEDLQELFELFKRLKENFYGRQDEIHRLLTGDAMNGRRYRSDYVQGWIDKMADWLQNELPAVSTFKRFDRFSIDVIRDYGTRKGEEAPQHPFFYCVKAYIDQVDRVTGWISAMKKELIAYVRRNIRSKKLSRGVMSYDDLLVLLDEALQRPETGTQLARMLREKFPVALVDEFQDTDPVQYHILRTIYPEGADDSFLCLVGDPKQSIYSFRGADLFSYLEARSEVPERQQYRLEYNFRAEKALIKAVNSIFSRLNNPFWVEDIRFSPAKKGSLEISPFQVDGRHPRLLKFVSSRQTRQLNDFPNKGESKQRAAALTAESIARLLNRGSGGEASIGSRHVAPGDIAVLVRKHEQAEMVREALEQRSIKSVQYSEKSVFETEEARFMELLLKAVAEPRNPPIVRAALSTPIFEHSAADLHRFQEEEESWINELESFTRWNAIWQQKGFTPMFHKVLQDERIKQHIVTLEQGERKLTNLLQIAELLQDHERMEHAGIFELIKWLAEKRRDSRQTADEEQLRLESDEDLVRVVTMHRSKGLEYPIVYIPFLWDGPGISDSGEPFLFHDEQRNYRASLDLNEKGTGERNRNRFRALQEEISESMRLTYVALTRAKNYCVVIHEYANNMEYSPLSYLLLGKQRIERHLSARLLSEERPATIQLAEYRDRFDQMLQHGAEWIAHERVDEMKRTPYRGDRAEPPAPKTRTYSGPTHIESRSVVSSFSSIMHPGTGDEFRGDDEFYLPEELSSPKELESPSIFTFPKGPSAGNCIHAVFEELDFTNRQNLDRVVADNLARFGYRGSWHPVLKQMVRTVLQTPLREEVSLDILTENDLVKEMEFYFDLPAFRRNRLLRIIRNRPGNNGDHSFEVNQGFMRGFIDLVFRIGDRYYIADYKSNYLGEDSADYAPGRLREEMELAGYDVQYHIYTVALHRYLNQRIRDYSYGKHVGGVFYLFVRGMAAADRAPEHGIYYDRPSYDTIQRIDNLFNRAGSAR
ncbi:MAG: exodeoxyribonuclease V subunit beta [Balneolaceae bacterium]|nr:exodeoxyribonuclease V subunit beta [Balneolaceae bacterium]